LLVLDYNWWRKVMSRYLLLMLIGCGNYNPYAHDLYQNVSNYPINYTQHTTKGIAVDDEFQLDLTDIDKRTDDVEACLSHLFPNGVIPNDVVVNGQCISNHFDTTIHREYIGVKLAPDWSWTPDACDTIGWGKQQVFGCGTAPDNLCQEKGLVVSAECPCCWRGAIQDNSVIITTPDLHLFDNDLIRLVSGCSSIWNNELSNCYKG
jgi:hypothetical protein